MKQLSIILAFIFSFFLVSNASPATGYSISREQVGSGDSLIFLLRNKEHLIQTFKTLKQLESGTSESIAPAKTIIVMCGESVKDLLDVSLQKTIASEVKKEKVIVMACGLSLNKFGIKKEAIPTYIGYTENGLILALEMQKKGYLSIEL